MSVSGAMSENAAGLATGMEKSSTSESACERTTMALGAVAGSMNVPKTPSCACGVGGANTKRLTMGFERRRPRAFVSPGVSVTVTVLAVYFLGQAIVWTDSPNIVYLGGGTALVIAALTYFLSKINKD